MKYFTRNEFRCKGDNCDGKGNNCGYNTVDYELAEILDEVRTYFNRPVIINSGCRCDEYNKSIGGSDNSQHRLGRAADIVVKDVKPELVYNYLNNKYQDSLGLGSYKTFTHVDTRDTKARWKG